MCNCDDDGHVHFVPDGQITPVINMSRGPVQPVIDVGVANRESVDDVMAVMHEVGRELRVVRRESLRRLKAAVDVRGIEIPYPHVTVHAGQDETGQSMAWSLQLFRAAPGA